MKTSKRLRAIRRHVALVAAAMLLPVVLMTPLVWRQASERAEGEAQVTAAAISRQLDNTLELVFANIKKAALLTGRSCEDSVLDLTRLSNESPYFRALLLIRDNAIYCTSSVGVTYSRPIVLFNSILPLRTIQQGLVLIEGTPRVPDRPILVATQNIGNGSGVLAIVDGQYIQDIQSAASYNGVFLIQITLSNTQKLLPKGFTSVESGKWIHGAVEKSTNFPIEVSVSISPELTAEYRDYIWMHYAPFLLLFCLLTGYLTHQWQQRRLSLVWEMRRGIQLGEFHMVYQPIIRMDTSEFCGLEALVRWNRRGTESVRPDIFIPLAEDNNMITDLTQHIFKLVTADLPKLGLKPKDHLGINVSSTHLTSSRFIDDVENLLINMGSERPKLILELTERELLPDSEIVQNAISQTRRRGVFWALDDFGTGHSSLAYLEKLPTDFIKIDKSFVSGIGTDSVNAVVLDTIISLAQRLEISLIAEGIETPQQLNYLTQRRVGSGQGYLFSAPLNAEEIGSWRRNFSSKSRNSS
ncbi:EAL domain-containing protein [Delftia lacustris]|uniref:EAL domain-containing protein n=1 Tax=Delftia lacustris TaxID=558537 RepID=UPI0035A642DD